MRLRERFDVLLQRELEEKLEGLVAAATEGSPEDWGKYTNLVGEIHGIRYSINALIRMREKIFEEEGEDA
jgi:hypothetical protein